MGQACVPLPELASGHSGAAIRRRLACRQNVDLLRRWRGGVALAASILGSAKEASTLSASTLATFGSLMMRRQGRSHAADYDHMIQNVSEVKNTELLCLAHVGVLR